MPHSGFEPEPTRLQSECHNHHIGWGGRYERYNRVITITHELVVGITSFESRCVEGLRSRPTKLIMTRASCTPVINRRFEHYAGDSAIWLGSTPFLRENTLGVVIGHPHLLFHQPHERTCDSTVI
ncbi:hypothetical protein TNCV_4414991 [Trichonephila clavipes]|uniref:Uncharacterized protein n=1 Tax=Trichonephila clavipes TaxID=2585209 RepID=A0A8X6S271_TRICX|nr:hypothetical protein TNCV_4414991 [Trichonephila clavipes]